MKHVARLRPGHSGRQKTKTDSGRKPRFASAPSWKRASEQKLTRRFAQKKRTVMKRRPHAAELNTNAFWLKRPPELARGPSARKSRSPQLKSPISLRSLNGSMRE